MINELHEVFDALKRKGVSPQEWYPDYKEIPKISDSAPCVRIMIADGEVLGVSRVKEELGSGLRKYGGNKGTYPCMNLAPLYRIEDAASEEELAAILPEEFPTRIDEIRSWCREDNWDSKGFRSKYKVSLVDKPKELAKILDPVATRCEELQVLFEETEHFKDPDVLHSELEKILFGMLEHGEDIELAKKCLFCAKGKDTNLSVAFETPKLVDRGIPAVSNEFVSTLNKALLNAASSESGSTERLVVDAFGVSSPQNSNPMPKIKLPALGEVSLRTMFKEQFCQHRYGLIGAGSYPLSWKIRGACSSALGWLADSEREGRTWIKLGPKEILFAYATSCPEASCAKIFKFQEGSGGFESETERFFNELFRVGNPNKKSRPELIEIFAIKTVDKGRAKTVYSRQIDSMVLRKCSQSWIEGCQNLPLFPFGSPCSLFPLSVADVLNRFWKRNGEVRENQTKIDSGYYGLRLLMGDVPSTDLALHVVSCQMMNAGPFLGRKLAVDERLDFSEWKKARELLALAGLLLYKKGLRKDAYMKNLPYLYGQLLRVSDELHVLYCRVVRDGQLPAQLVGGSAFQSAAEMPFRTLAMLGQRMSSYVSWARIYRGKGESEKGKESWRAGWLLSLYEKTAAELVANWDSETRFDDEEKAQLFIGYLASFPKKKAGKDDLKDSVEEETEDE